MNTGHNSNSQLRSIIERIEAIETQRAELAADVKEIYQESKSAGFDTKAIRAIIRGRKQDPDERKAHEATVQMYLEALGDFATSPLGQAAMARAVA